ANKIFHSKYQILSMISTTFKEMYSGTDYSVIVDTWNERKQNIAKNLVQYYVYDIITNYWGEGGTHKIHSAAKPNRYRIEISSRAWRAALDGFFEKSMLRAERKRDRKSTRLNSSHVSMSYAVFCLKKKKTACCSLISTVSYILFCS